ncbi:excinuclease ABC subunit UvrA [Candidatus Kuenenbacteria bacterium CG_4_9_14_3_um_filter_39_14]|uniref:UvrABC system protein A n=6 Tax=Candidatus Kueneniibacteriota TaxID=1752740 RepID=A0A2M7MFX6_9BACT|nr:excinuclease ABC subunit UvrA [Candidatus Kuenenbacteria bacterium]OIP55348.1 MAG: excinuclease ABC subunit A [Candidatus Kuenenbacteria bacterium CG2_30_39_24]PIP28713.1 MAG: excinuclease ABC subunit A [Candidatus Kuenenbacteria bacterium CG23_combo_of_CG06-09_8_20_14_all_39_39]PIR80489.1 MAG: excinuclease ABC subunit UvrA [Candidatus Kuenenbacteria bacterium CG10_big_fil_rev_8_21_14_0_10_39_14]PIX92008.1 MAG: excinuclease ABC subunit UvrA [Candidatus Kuenenbacteria bacterium CG_4_10_14_3_u
MDKIKIFGARVHNLKNINVAIPKNKLVVFTGLSGSGKSSLAFDTIYAEGQRRYMESLSTYARQFLGNKEKAEVDRIEGLAPAIAIDQRAEIHNPRSTVGTMTEIYDYLRIFFTNLGRPHCPKCGALIKAQTIEEIAQEVSALCRQSQILILAPLARNKKGRQREMLLKIKEAKFDQVRIDGYICPIEEALEHNFDETKVQTIEVVVDRIMLANNRMVRIDCNELKKNHKQNDVFYKLLTTALDLGNGIVMAYDIERQKDYLMSQHLICSQCKVVMDRLEPGMFSFNSPRGACHACGGLGTRLEVDPDLVMPNKKLTILEGAIRPWSRLSGSGQTTQIKGLEKLAAKYGFFLNTPLQDMTQEQLEIVLYGEGKSNPKADYEGVANNLLRRLSETNSGYLKSEIEKYMRVQECSVCQGKRLQDKILMVKVGNKSISDVAQMTLPLVIKFLNQLTLEKKEKTIAQPLVAEINSRLQLIINIGLDYLTLDRPMVTLSGGEVQKIRLATQIGSNLTGVIYILDEPSIGLHERDNKKLIKTLRKLQELGNTVIVVEHDATIIRAADWVVDIGPGAGKHGGEIVAEGTADEIKKNKNSLTGEYLCGRKKIDFNKKQRTGNGQYLEVIGASEFNLKNITVKIPLGRFICITGVSGSGKSTLMIDILSRALNKYFYGTKDAPGKHGEIRGLSNINKVVTIDQSPIGRTPRSNPATYTGVFTYIRELFAAQPEARIKGFDAGHFSFNARGGRCEACQGDGEIKIEMHFLSDIYVECEQCGGKRYNSEALEIYWRGENIAQVLEMNVEEALEFFQDEPQIKAKLDILNKVGLGYIRLGQPAPTLSGGEAQRVKLATELSRRATGKTLYILDEPTIGLHFDDVNKLLGVLNKLADMGNTILVIEHNLDVIRSADYIIDLGPEGGDKGGEIVATGTPAEVAKVKNSYTGQYLRKRELADKYE